MVELTSAGAEICVIGRCDFRTGIGSMTFALCEMLARSFPVCILPTEPSRRGDDAVYLPSGRRVAVCHDLRRIRVAFFCDVLWNGVHDNNHLLVPQEDCLRIAYIVFDSDALPDRWVQILNDRFDVVAVTSPHLLDTARSSGVERPLACLPIALDIGALLAEPTSPPGARVRFGCIAAFHPRKGIETLLEAFLGLYGGRADVELLLHSNVSIGPTIDNVRRRIAASGAANVIVSTESLPEAEKNALVRSIDIYVNCSRGEAYSVGPREAMALGKPVVLSDVGGHKDLAGVPGVFMVAPTLTVPARFPEIDNQVFGRQSAVEAPAVARALEEALAFVRSPAQAATVHDRRERAADFSFARLSATFAEILHGDVRLFRRAAPAPAAAIIPPEAKAAVAARLGRRAERLGFTARHVVPAHDGGFFSVFNAFFSHLVWDQHEERCHAVLPDWDIDRMIRRLGTNRFQSFCYGRPGDGNLWLHLFEPLYGYSAAEFDDEAVLWHRARRPDAVHNEHREPLMTYIHAYKLYGSPSFAAWRRQYHRVFRDHIRLRPELRAEMDGFLADQFRGRTMLGAHVRHPSHTVEQPGAVIAHAQVYIDALRAEAARRGLRDDDDGWGVFLATDQERVVRQFEAAFGARLACFPDVRRTRAAEDAAFDSLAPDQQNADGHQLQHLVAADPDQWSIRMAWEVVRDAYAMAACTLLLHVVSNVSTAVAYMNPELEMIFCSPSPPDAPSRDATTRSTTTRDAAVPDASARGAPAGAAPRDAAARELETQDQGGADA